MAQKFPQYLNRMVILSAAPVQRFVQELVSNLDQLRRSWYILSFQIPGIPEWLIQQNLAEFVKNLLREQAIRKGAFTKEDTQMYQSALAKPGALSAALNYYRQMFSPWNWVRDWMNTPNPITVPTLVLWGEEDSLVTPKVTRGLERLIAAPFNLKLIPHCGHWLQQEAPQTVNRELLAFLRNE